MELGGIDQVSVIISVVALFLAGASYNHSRKTARRSEQIEYANRIGYLRSSHTQALGKLHSIRLTIFQQKEVTASDDIDEALNALLLKSENDLEYLREADTQIDNMPSRLIMIMINSALITETFSSFEETRSKLENIKVWCEQTESFL